MMRKLILLALILTVVLVSCGPVTPISTTQTLTAQVRVTASPTPFFTPTPGPSADVSSYQLRTWDEESFQREFVTYGYINEIFTFDKEFLLKFPESKRRYELTSNILIAEPETIVPGLPSDDPTGGMIAQLLNDGVQLQELQGKLEDLGWLVDQTISIKNLIGNGEDAFILMLNTQWGSKMGVFAVTANEEGYHVYKIRDWDEAAGPARAINFEINNVGDTNGNGLPEIILEEWYFSGGFITSETTTIDHFEWIPQNMKFQQTRFDLVAQQCLLLDGEFEGATPVPGTGSCRSDWKFSNDGSQNRLVSQSYWYTHVGCPDLIIQRISAWGGARYVLGTSEILPPDGILSSECRLAWADTAISLAIPEWESADLTVPGWENDLAISIIEESLENWPAKADEWWGTASRDYFMLRLGLWYELRGEKIQATSLLQHVETRPHDSRFDFTSRLAQQYLQERTAKGSLEACNDLGEVFFQEYHKVVSNPTWYRYGFSAKTALMAMMDAWGFVYTGGKLCNDYFMLPAELKNQHVTSTDALTDWLNTLPYSVYQNTVIDLNGDGSEDHLVYLETGNQGDLTGWVFFMTSDGYTAKYFDESSTSSVHSEITIIPLEINSGLNAFMLQRGSSIFINLIAPDLRVELDDTAYAFDVHSYKIVSPTQPVQIKVDIKNQDEQKTVIFSWDDRSQSFVEQNAIDLEISQIEKALYVDRDYPSVINRVDTLLVNLNFVSNVAMLCGISVADDFCVDFPEEYAAYLLYMRALSFEQMGLVNDARDAYYQLWQKYPQNLFGIIASKKLEPVQP
jgi:hypothetical protein